MLEAFGEKWRDFFFFPKESRGQKFIFRGFPHRGVFSLSNLEFLRRQFSTHIRCRIPHVEKRGKEYFFAAKLQIEKLPESE